MADVTSSLSADSLNKVVPKDQVNGMVAEFMGKLNSAVGGANAKVSGGPPTALPSSYETGDGETKALNYEGGMTMGNIVDWTKYLTVKTYPDAGSLTTGSAGASNGADAGSSPPSYGPAAKVRRRIHPRAL
jgi:hypothetical protein